MTGEKKKSSASDRPARLPGAEPESVGRKFLLCPSCGEMLFQPDIEIFLSCPYCDYRFERTPELEDFLLEPVIRSWIRSQESLPLHMRNPE